MKAPSRVRIGGQVFKIEERPKTADPLLSDNTYGYTLDSGNLIVIDKELALTKKQQVVIHEILHAMRMVFEGPAKPSKKDSYDTWEHHFIGVWEAGMLMFLKDNPKVVAWLAHEESDADI